MFSPSALDVAHRIQQQADELDHAEQDLVRGRITREEFDLVWLHAYEATANIVVGVASGEAHGNAFRWRYTLALEPDAAVATVDLRHWMYLQDGGATLVNRVTISKLGIVVGQVTEYFRRVPEVGADPR